MFRLRAAQGVLGLRDKHTPTRLEAACHKAIAAGDPSHRTIKGILIAGTETPAADPTRTAVAADVPAFLHGPKALFALREHDDPAPVLELPTATPNADTGPGNRAAQA